MGCAAGWRARRRGGEMGCHVWGFLDQRGRGGMCVMKVWDRIGHGAAAQAPGLVGRHSGKIDPGVRGLFWPGVGVYTPHHNSSPNSTPPYPQQVQSRPRRRARQVCAAGRRSYPLRGGFVSWKRLESVIGLVFNPHGRLALISGFTHLGVADDRWPMF